MNGNSHLLFSTTVSTMIALNIDKVNSALPNISVTPETITLIVVGGIVGGVLPDIDNPKSYVGKLTYPLSKWIGDLGKWHDTSKEYKYHRGIMHDLMLWLILLVVSYFFAPPLCAVCIGCLTHIYLDLYNPVGVPVLVSNRSIHIGSINANSKSAITFTRLNVIIALIVGLYIKFVYDLFPIIL